MKKITINKIGESYWYIPTIFTKSRHSWHPRPYKSLKKLLVIEKHLEDNLLVRLNKDKDLKTFKFLQQIKNFPLTLKKSQIEALELNQIIKIEILELKPIIYLDYKSLSFFKRGFLPFCSIDFLNEEFKNEKNITWRKYGFVKFKKPK